MVQLAVVGGQHRAVLGVLAQGRVQLHGRQARQTAHGIQPVQGGVEGLARHLAGGIGGIDGGHFFKEVPRRPVRGVPQQGADLALGELGKAGAAAVLLPACGGELFDGLGVAVAAAGADVGSQALLPGSGGTDFRTGVVVAQLVGGGKNHLRAAVGAAVHRASLVGAVRVTGLRDPAVPVFLLLRRQTHGVAHTADGAGIHGPARLILGGLLNHLPLKGVIRQREVGIRPGGAAGAADLHGDAGVLTGGGFQLQRLEVVRALAAVRGGGLLSRQTGELGVERVAAVKAVPIDLALVILGGLPADDRLIEAERHPLCQPLVALRAAHAAHLLDHAVKDVAGLPDRLPIDPDMLVTGAGAVQLRCQRGGTQGQRRHQRHQSGTQPVHVLLFHIRFLLSHFFSSAGCSFRISPADGLSIPCLRGRIFQIL